MKILLKLFIIFIGSIITSALCLMYFIHGADNPILTVILLFALTYQIRRDIKEYKILKEYY